MGNLLYAINVVLPLVLLVALGYLLKKINLVNDGFIAGANKIVYYVGVPAMLFKSVYDADFKKVNFTYIVYIIVISVVLFALACIVFRSLFNKENKAGTLINAFIRANYTIIGIPLVSMMFVVNTVEYNETLALVSLVAAFVLPLYNILGVIGLSLDSKQGDFKSSMKVTLKKIITNPLIIGLLIGLVFSIGRLLFNIETHYLEEYTPFLYKAIDSVSTLTTPLALIMVGAKFRFKKSKELLPYLIAGVIARSIVMPIVSFMIALIFFDFTAIEYAVMFACFVSPTAVSSVPVTVEMGGDEELGGQMVVYTVLFSPFIIVILLTILKTIGAM